MTLFTFNGTFIFLAYASNIFAASGTDIDEKISSIIIAAIQLVGSIVSIFLVDTIGRRLLLIVSSIGCTFGLIAMGAHNYCVINEINVDNWYWIPVTSLSLTYFFACIGLMPLGFIITAEVLPGNVNIYYFVNYYDEFFLFFISVTIIWHYILFSIFKCITFCCNKSISISS